MIRRLLHLLTALLLGWGLPAQAQTFAVSSIGSASMGNVAAAATGQSIFRAAAASGTVTKLSGNAVLLSAPSVRSLITVACGNQIACTTSDAQVTISTVGTPSGRTAALQNFTVSTAGATATITLAPGSGSSITFRIGPVGRNSSKTFWLGYDMPINGDNGSGTTGSALSGFVVTVSRTTGASPSALNGSAAANVFRSLAITNSGSLSFGRISRPSSGNGTVALSPSTGKVTVTGTGVAHLAAGSTSAAAFTISGEGGQSISITVPTTITLTGTAATLTVSTNPSISGAQVLSGALGTAGSMPLRVGGSFSLSPSTPAQTYSGTFAVTVQYN